MFQNSVLWTRRAILCFILLFLSLQEYCFVASEQITTSVNASSSQPFPKSEVTDASKQLDEKKLENSITSLSELVISELEIVELSGFNGLLANGHCCTGTKTRNSGCQGGQYPCNTYWRVCITDLSNDPSTESLLFREVPEKKPEFTARVSRFSESSNRSSDLAQDRSDKAFLPYQIEELLDNPSDVRCRLGFHEKGTAKRIKVPLKFSKTISRQLLQNKKQLQVNEPIDLNVLLIVELRARHPTNKLKSALISRQVQNQTIHIPGVKVQTSLSESNDFLGGPQPIQPGKDSVETSKDSDEASKDSDEASKDSDEIESDTNSTQITGRSENRVEKARTSGLWYKYRWRLKVYNNNVLITVKNITIDPHVPSLLRNFNSHICKNGFTGNYCEKPMCAEGCHSEHGYCKQPGECQCRQGWRGESCSYCQTLSRCQRGTCQRPFECKCEKGFSGKFCSVARCREGCHAQNGYCLEPDTCECRSGWQGPDCTECDTAPGCLHGTCQKPLECLCKPGWTGKLCDIAAN